MKTNILLSAILFFSFGIQAQVLRSDESVSFYYLGEQETSIKIEKLTVWSNMKLQWYTATISKADGQVQLVADYCTTPTTKVIENVEYLDPKLPAYPDGSVLLFPMFEKLKLKEDIAISIYPNGEGGNILSQDTTVFSSIIDNIKIPGLTNCN